MYPSERFMSNGKRVPPSMFTVRGDHSIPLRKPGERVSPKAEPTFNYHTIRFIRESHAKRLLQMHQYFEQILELRIGYYSRIALLVAFSSRGDMITVRKLFSQWQEPQWKETHRQEQDGLHLGGKEMYSAVIRGLVGQNFRDSERRSYYITVDHMTGTKNNGITQMYAALELFYDLLRKGGTPTFETYHSLVVGMAAFKNDLEAAELLLDHMIIKKRKPYVQVLHIMCREYVRRKDFARAERIFGMLQEYGIRPKALTCNLMLRAVFRTSSADALRYLGQTNNNIPDSIQGSEALEAMACQLKRQRIQEIREYMRENDTAPDQDTFSTLIYGYGHMEDGYPDLKGTMVEMSREHSQIEPNLIVLNSLLFAHLNHGKIKFAESILNQMLNSFHPAIDRVVVTNKRRTQQQPSPFRKSMQESKTEDKSKSDWKWQKWMVNEKLMMVPGKGTFHALMLAHVERGDIVGMERILDRMAQTRQQQQDQQYELEIRYQLMPRVLRRPLLTMVDLEADEHTANIMLLGYLKQRNFVKADIIQRQIQSRSDWKTSSLFQDREENRQELIEFVRQQSSQVIVERSLLENDDDGEPPISSDSNNGSSRGTAAVFDPLSGKVEGELDDDIEIDVTTLSAKLRELMKPLSPTSSTSPSPTTSSSSSSPPPPDINNKP
ncbi:hypothetical protein BGZ65_011731 [Modicella reniformis]|uniref:Pentatricopeptide repeat-containing protein n=1 Tax=Modicella reniformis TaxID=1440133 RepID=A0A9P6SP30_9FUNG|nr:hypothetical protein BGZ65_011731 [Modicella reniformis]